jgi:hypothetical protein
MLDVRLIESTTAGSESQVADRNLETIDLAG